MAITPLDVGQFGGVAPAVERDPATDFYAPPDELRSQFCRRVMRLRLVCPHSRVHSSAALFIKALDRGVSGKEVSSLLFQIDEDLFDLELGPEHSKMVTGNISDVRESFDRLARHFMAVE